MRVQYIDKAALLAEVKVLREKEMYNSYQYRTIIEVIDIIEKMPTMDFCDLDDLK